MSSPVVAVTEESVLSTAIARLNKKVNQYRLEMDENPSFIAHTYLSYYQSQLRILTAVETRLDKHSIMTGNLAILYPDELSLAKSIVELPDV
jgi:hypothetical protein